MPTRLKNFFAEHARLLKHVSVRYLDNDGREAAIGIVIKEQVVSIIARIINMHTKVC